MGRITDTRSKVREAAAIPLSRGVTPTPTKVRELIGGGSPNVIVDELRKLREAPAEGAGAQEAKRAPAGALANLPEALKGLGQEQLAEHLQQAQALQMQLDATGQLMAQFVQAANDLLQSMRDERGQQQTAAFGQPADES